MRTVIASAALIALGGPPGLAEVPRIFTGADFERACASAQLKNWCEGFVVGVLQTDSLAQLVLERPRPFCIPEFMNAPAIVALTYAFLDRNKDHRPLAATVAVSKALREYFPCPAPQ